MKRLFVLILTTLCITAGFAQSGNTGAERKNKALVVYFSRAGENWAVGVVDRGNTAVMVDYIVGAARVDTFQIVPVKAYPQSYQACIDTVRNEVNRNARPAYKYECDNVADYDTVFIGGPIWWGRPPMIIRTFLEAHPELADKTLVPFGTHGGSGISSYTNVLREYFPNATILEGLGISGSSIRTEAARSRVVDWLKSIDMYSDLTGIQSAETSTRHLGRAYRIDGTLYQGGRGLYIQDGKKYIAK